MLSISGLKPKVIYMSTFLKWASEYSFAFWIFLSLDNMFTLRLIIFDMLVGSFDGKYNTCRKKAVAIRKQQNLLSRFSLNYIEEYVCDKLRKPYKRYMAVKVLYEIWLVGSFICMISVWACDFNNELLVKGVIFIISLLIWILLFIPYNPMTRRARQIDFKFPNR